MFCSSSSSEDIFDLNRHARDPTLLGYELRVNDESERVNLTRHDDDNSTTNYEEVLQVVGRDFPMSEFLRSGTIS